MKKIVLFLLVLTFQVSASPVLPDLPYFEGNKIIHIKDGEELGKMRFSLIENATSSVYLSTYTITPDEVGMGIFEVLCRKSQEGLEVRLLTDHRSSLEFIKYTTRLKECGVYTLSFRPDNMMYALHQKLLIVDGQKLIMGGSNYSDKYHLAAPNSHLKNSKLRRNGRFGWYDSDYIISGPAACGFHYQFQSNFKHLAVHLADYNYELYHFGFEYFKSIFANYYGLSNFKSCIPQDEPGDENIIPIIGQPYKNEKRPIMEAHLKAIKETRKGERILLYAPYFVPGKIYVDALDEAVKRGVDVSVITNSVESNDEQKMGNILFIGMIEAIRPMLKAGVKVYLWNIKSTIHRKGGVYGKIAFFGSDNLDNRAQEYSSESVVFTNSPDVVNGVIEDYEKDLVRGTVLLTPKYVQKILSESTFFDKTAGKLLKSLF